MTPEHDLKEQKSYLKGYRRERHCIIWNTNPTEAVILGINPNYINIWENAERKIVSLSRMWQKLSSNESVTSAYDYTYARRRSAIQLLHMW
ncbi:hypothetical protein NPIL_209891 [Nephila pilipes]|uniref:Uncharacterized protein n=1 Tax=Nephila pilipes TaxID=299642 RepID=A0A8X6PCE2_NEPPI|nr:hypothetical protein NPIL_209891 [Nephila pilipes]